MKRLISKLGIALCLSMAALGCGGDDGSEPPQTMVGDWDFIGFSDAGVEATTTGTAAFRADGTLSWNGTVTYPGESTDPLVFDGTYEQTGSSLVLTVGSDPGTNWTIAVSGNEVLLTQVEVAPANTIRLRRQ
jgi:hypothetical protein